MNTFGLAARASAIRWMAASESLVKRLPSISLSALPVPSNLKWVTPLILDERQHLLVEVLVVDRAGEGELAIAQLVAELGGMGDPLIPWLVVATPGEPDPELGMVAFGRTLELAETALGNPC